MFWRTPRSGQDSILLILPDSRADLLLTGHYALPPAAHASCFAVRAHLRYLVHAHAPVFRPSVLGLTNAWFLPTTRVRLQQRGSSCYPTPVRANCWTVRFCTTVLIQFFARTRRLPTWRRTGAVYRPAFRHLVWLPQLLDARLIDAVAWGLAFLNTTTAATAPGFVPCAMDAVTT